MPLTMPATDTQRHHAFHVLAKPIGPICNLDCTYCFYLETEALYTKEQYTKEQYAKEPYAEANNSNEKTTSTDWRMNPELLERFIRLYIENQSGSQVAFAWQGGEPTLLGVDFFRRVVALQKKHCPAGKEISNALQTNGTLLDEEWCLFLKEHSFLIGLSIDGPADLHDYYRVDKGGKTTHAQVVAAAQLLCAHHIEFNILCVVHRQNAREPLRVYRFLKELGTPYIQFIPIVEKRTDSTDSQEQHGCGSDTDTDSNTGTDTLVTDWSVRANDYGDFLNAIFDEWVHHDIGIYYVQLFDVQLEIRYGHPSSLCVYAETCGSALAIEHNGDVYSCDHYVDPEYLLGNIQDHSLRDMVDAPQQHAFGQSKKDSLPQDCLNCEFLQQCHGECPKNRIMHTLDGEPGLNYLCHGLKKFFRHSMPYFDRMLALIAQRRRPAELMAQLRHEEHPLNTQSTQVPSDQEPCPCGSGRTFKRCHGRGV